ncbi:hypothetical protein AN958_07373 [Leucoagaricus sp. SymC.cos]|nr:hypothetical protein AN958_07373 [Leucoagaricus sp. SymC.cos]
MTSAPYRFTSTQDWFSHNIPSWTALIDDVKRRTSSPRALEIGSWEGRSAVFLLTELCNPGGFIVCIDHFDIMNTAAGRERYEKIQHNLRLAGPNDNYRVLPQFSFPALMSLLEEEIGRKEPGFDWIYIDGSHEADDTLLDGELCWRLAKKGAIVIFDDYHWDAEPENSKHHPKRGIDTFLKFHEGEYTRLSDTSHYQVVLRKDVEMRIGFLVQEKSSGRSEEALGYGVNLALAINSSFAMPAAVAIQGAVKHTPGRMSIYIVDCGLTEEDKTKLLDCLPKGGDVTMSFLPLPSTSITKEQGPVWAKLDLCHILPVERALYLDADILVRANIIPLWRTDLQDRAIGAVPDVGHPMGHGAAEKHPYFNAGVLLMNLAKIRESADSLLEKGREMRMSTFRDQDALNAHFKDWVPLPLCWNAQGLGTYARYPSTDRERLKLEEMNDPAIVHFTGPVNPSLEEILNPYVQPPTAKPWGYVGAPGHPFAEEWWKALSKTPYADYENSDIRVSTGGKAIERAIEEAVRKFKERVSEETARVRGHGK